MTETLLSPNESVPDSIVEANQLGRQLAAAREQCGLSIADVARQLRLTPRQVEAMESGDIQQLPGPVFARGFIRNYARLVKLDPAPLLPLSAQQQQPSAVPPEQVLAPSADIPFPTGRSYRLHKYAIAALVVVAVLVAYEFYHDEGPPATATTRQVELPAAQPVTDAKPADAQAAPQVAPVEEGASPPAAGVPAPVVPEKAAPSMKRSAGERLLKLSFARDSWVEIRDRYGRKIFSQLNPAGSEQAISGEPPLTLVVGNAVGVRVMLNDQQVDLAPHIKVDVARLTLE